MLLESGKPKDSRRKAQIVLEAAASPNLPRGEEVISTGEKGGVGETRRGGRSVKIKLVKRCSSVNLYRTYCGDRA